MIKYNSPFKAQALTSGDVVAYQVAENTLAQIRALTFHNTTASSISVEVYLLPATVSASAPAHRLVKKTLLENESYLCPEIINHVLTPQMSVVLVGDGVNAMLSVAEQAV